MFRTELTGVVTGVSGITFGVVDVPQGLHESVAKVIAFDISKRGMLLAGLEFIGRYPWNFDLSLPSAMAQELSQTAGTSGKSVSGTVGIASVACLSNSGNSCKYLRTS
jgi:hypothetical protein